MKTHPNEVELVGPDGEPTEEAACLMLVTPLDSPQGEAIQAQYRRQLREGK